MLKFFHPIKKITSDSGSNLYICPINNARTVTCLAHVETGSIHECEFLGYGLSHFLEHMMFSGTEKYPGKTQIQDSINEVGGHFNAFTTYNATTYYMNVPKDFTTTALSMLIDMMRNPIFPEKSFQKESSIISHELEMYNDNPDCILWERLLKELLTNSPYSIPIIGIKQKIKNVTREMMIKYHHRRYTPNHISFVVAGAVPDETTVIQCFQKYTENWDAQYYQDLSSFDKILTIGEKKLNIFFHDPVPRTIIGWLSPVYSIKEKAADTLLASAITSDIGPFMQKLRYNTPAISEFNLDMMMLGKNRLTTASMQTGEKYQDYVEEKLFKEIERRKKNGVTKSELQKYRNDTEYSQYLVFSDTLSCAKFIANTASAYRNIDFQTILDSFMNVNAEDACMAAQRCFPEKAFTCIKMNNKIIQNNNSCNTTKKEESIDPPQIIDLSRHAKLLVLEDDSTPIVELNIIFPAGQVFELSHEMGISHFLSSCFPWPTEKYTEEEINEIINCNSLKLNAESGMNSFIITLSCLKNKLNIAINLLHSILYQPKFTPQMVQREKEILHNDILSSLNSNPLYIAIDKLQKNLLGLNKHPYGNSREDILINLKKITHQNIYEFFYNHFHVNDGIVSSLTGDITQGKAKKIASKLLPIKNISVNKRPVIPMPPNIIGKSKKLSVFLPNLNQAIIVIGWNTEGVESGNAILASIFREAENGMSSPIFKKIREEKGFAYYTAISSMQGFSCGYTFFMAGTSTEHANEVIRLMKSEIKNLINHGITKEIFEAAKAKILFSWNSSSIFELMLNACLDEYLGRGALSTWERKKELQNITLSKFNEYLRNSLSEKKLITVTVLPENNN